MITKVTINQGIQMNGKFLLIYLLILNCLLANSSETDDFYIPNPIPKLINEELNRFVNNELKLIETKINLNLNNTCDRNKLKDFILYELDQNFPKISIKIWESANPKKKNSLIDGELYKFESSMIKQGKDHKNTVYEGFNYAPNDCCVPRFNFNGTLAGIDKLDHFFSGGGMLWEKYEKDGDKNFAKIMEMNVNMENGSWGLAGPGVKSYGDLAANWHGLQFYHNLLDGNEPYFKCINNKWVNVKKFDIAFYADDLWDESVNCSAFPELKQADHFAKNLRSRHITCPMLKSKCENLKLKYRDRPLELASIFSSVCLGKVTIDKAVEPADYFNWENILNIFDKTKLEDVAREWRALHSQEGAQ
jgi:hypothetical protein